MTVSKNPVEEYFQEKTAVSFGAGLQAGLRGNHVSAGQLGQRMGQGLVNTGIGAVGAGAVAGAAFGAQKIYDAATKARDFRSMLEADPRLAQLHQEDPRRVNQMFSTLRTFNPSFTRDPIVASHYVLQMASDPVHAGSIATDVPLNSRDKMKNPLADRVVGAAFHRAEKK